MKGEENRNVNLTQTLVVVRAPAFQPRGVGFDTRVAQ